MKRFTIPLVLLVVLTALVMAGYFSGVLRSPADPISVSEAVHGEVWVTVLRLRDAATRRHWHSEGEHHRVDIRREGANLYHFDIALLEGGSAPLARSMRSSLELSPGRHWVGAFSYDDVGQQRVERRIELVIEE